MRLPCGIPSSSADLLGDIIWFAELVPFRSTGKFRAEAQRRGVTELQICPLCELRASARNNLNPRTSAAFVLLPPRPVLRERAGVRVFRIFRITCDSPVAFLHRPQIYWP